MALFCCAAAVHQMCTQHTNAVTRALQAEARQLKYPHVADFLEYVKFRWMVSFRKLEDPKARHPRKSPLW